MADHEWNSRTKSDLMIEVWEKLDCESVGKEEIEAIETVVRDCFGEGASDAPVVIARLLADEGAVLRHSEILEMDVRRRLNSPYRAMFKNLVRYSTFAEAERSLAELSNLRAKLESVGDREGLKRVRDEAVRARDGASSSAAEEPKGSAAQRFHLEISEWFAIWLHSPELFASWLAARKASASFAEDFGNDGD